MNEQQAGQPVRQGLLPLANLNLGQLRDRVEFLRGFCRHPAQVGSVIPSSHQLEQRLVRKAHISEAGAVVELGPGTGGTTAALLRAMRPSARLLAIELDSDFHRHLCTSRRDPRLAVELGSAEHLARFLAAHCMDMPDSIVSGIPFSTMPPEVAGRVAGAIAQVLRPGGRFVAYQVRAHVAHYATPYLGQPQKEWELVNIPPVRVFTWVKPDA